MARTWQGVFHDNLNMSASRLCLFLTVLVSVKMMAAQPLFGQLFCDMLCDDDDDDEEYDSSDLSTFFDMFFDCSDCSDKKPSKTKNKTTTPSPSAMQQPFNLVIPPANGMNVTMSNTGNSWLMNFMPWAAKPAAATTAPAATTAAPGTTAAGTTAAGGTTAAATTTAKA